MNEQTFTSETQARVARRTHINKGRSVSLIAYDPSRELYVFDILK